MNLWYLPTAENAETTSKSATTETVNDQTTAADIELTTVTDEVTDSLTQTQTGKYKVLPSSYYINLHCLFCRTATK